MEPFAVEGLSVGEPSDESFGGFGCGDVYAKGSTCVRFVVAISVLSGRGPGFDVFESSMPFDFGESLGGGPSYLDGPPGMPEEVPIGQDAPGFA